MRKIEKSEITAVSRLFEGWDETMIKTCLSGLMGEILASDDLLSASAFISDFCFLAGVPSRELITYDYNRKFLIMAFQNREWETMIEELLPEARCHTRFATKKENHFDTEKLLSFSKNIPLGFEIRQIDEDIYNYCKITPWCRDFVINYPTFEEYEKYGLGFVSMHRGEVAAGASSYTTYPEGIEIEIDTKEEYRNLGLATVCGASLILKCLEKKIYPSWDAHDARSLHLAEKLGYKADKPYKVYIIEK